MKNMIQVQTLKGFRDFLPAQARKRQYVISTLKKVFESFGFEPLETPALEYEEILLGKYGEEGDKLMYRFEDLGGRRVALRYDQTVPLARVVAQYASAGSAQVLPIPFKRYQIQPVWRAENTQKGRYREFLQCDADIVGSPSLLADAEILSLVLEIYKGLGLNVTIKINDRSNFEGLDKKIVATIDKLEKIGEEAVIAEMIEKGMTPSDAESTLKNLQQKPIANNLKQILDYLKTMGQDLEKIKYDPTMARGLDYYTGLIFETVAEGSTGSICSGGRYDNLIGSLSGTQIPSIGFGLGFDRTVEVLELKGLLPAYQPSAKILVTILPMDSRLRGNDENEDLEKKSLDVTHRLRSGNINTEIYLDSQAKLEKQLKYADAKGIPYAIIIGPEEAESEKVVLKNLKTRTQDTLTLDELLQKLT